MLKGGTSGIIYLPIDCSVIYGRHSTSRKATWERSSQEWPQPRQRLQQQRCRPTASEHNQQGRLLRTRSTDGLRKTTWGTQLQHHLGIPLLRSSRRWGQRQSWRKGYHVGLTGLSRRQCQRHDSRWMHLRYNQGPTRRQKKDWLNIQYGSDKGWRPRMELKWSSWAHGQRVGLGAPGKSEQEN